MMEPNDKLTYGFRVDDAACVFPEQAFSVQLKDQSICFMFLLSAGVAEILQEIDNEGLRDSWFKSGGLKRRIKHAKKEMSCFSLAQESAKRCLVMQSSFDAVTLKPDAPIGVFYQDMHISAYLPRATRDDVLGDALWTQKEWQVENAFNFIEKMTFQTKGRAKRLDTMALLSEGCTLLQKQMFSEYAAQEGFSILQQVQHDENTVIVARPPDQLFGENADSVSTTPMRTPAALVNWLQVLRDRRGGNARSHDDMAAIAARCSGQTP